MTCSHHNKGEPAGYLAWFAWAERMSKTHTQTRCPVCKLFKIWVQKEES